MYPKSSALQCIDHLYPQISVLYPNGYRSMPRISYINRGFVGVTLIFAYLSSYFKAFLGNYLLQMRV